MGAPVTAVLAVARAGYGLLALAVPERPAARRRGRALEPRERLLIRMIGARQLAQACLTGPAPTATVLALGAGADALHALSMAALAIGSRRWRPIATAGALNAAAFAVAGALATRLVRGKPPAPHRWAAVRLRDRCAQPVARRLLPRAWGAGSKTAIPASGRLPPGTHRRRR